MEYGYVSDIIYWLHVLSGVRQGVVISPALSNRYVDFIISERSKSVFDCHVHGIYLGWIMYDDGLLLTSDSVTDLQSMDAATCHIYDSYFSLVRNLMLTFRQLAYA